MPGLRFVLLPFLALALSAAAPAAEWTAPVAGADHDWPQWRGPNRDGQSLDKNLLKEWPKEGPPLVFTLTGLGQGQCAPAVVGGRLYTIGKLDNQAYAQAYDISTQKRLWETKFAAGARDGEHATPTVDGQRVYVMGGLGDVAAFDADTGKILWQKSMAKEFNSTLQLGHYGYSEGPLVDGDKLVITPGKADCAMVACNKETGEVLWKSTYPHFWNAERPGDTGFLGQGNDNAGYSSIVISEAAGVKQYINLTGRGLISVAASDGRFLWGYNRIAQGHTNIPTPIVSGDYVFTSNGYGGGTGLLKLSKEGDGVKATQVYYGGEIQNHCGQYVLNDKYIYMGEGTYGGTPICLDLLTGKIVWRAAHADGKGVAGVIAADGNLIFRYQSNEVVLIEMTPKGYHAISSFVPPHKNEGLSHPVIARGLLYLRDQGTLNCYDLRQH